MDFIKRAVRLSEAKHLLLLFLKDESKNDARFFSRDCGIRITLADALKTHESGQAF